MMIKNVKRETSDVRKDRVSHFTFDVSRFTYYRSIFFK